MDISKAHLHWRVCRRGSKEYRSYSLARSFRENGKVRKEILVKLGKLSKKEVHQWQMALKALKGNCSAVVTAEDIVTEANYAYLDVAVLLETWHSWGLSKVFANDGKRVVPLWIVVVILTINRCVDPSSKSRVASWFQQTALPFILNIDPSQINPSRIFRELTIIEKQKPDLCNYLYQEVTTRDPSSMESVFCDLSSTTFSGSRCILMNWGHCKEGFKNHIVLALVVNKKGLPVYWEVLFGNTADVTTIEWLLRNLRSRFKIAQPSMIFDRGMVSDDNLSLLEDEDIKYISAMDRNQLTSLADVTFESFSDMTAEEVEKKVCTSKKFTNLNESTYYHEVEMEKDAKRRYILCFNPQLCSDQKEARSNGITHFEQKVRDINRELLNAKSSRNKESTLKKFKREMSIEQQGFLEIKLRQKSIETESQYVRIKKISTYQGKVIIHKEKVQDAGKLDGFRMIVTNHIEKNGNDAFEMNAEEVIKPYRDKVVIESSFRDIKSFLDISPIHVWTIDHVKAHYTICILAYLLDRTLTLRLHEKTGVASKDIVAHPRLYAELEKCLLNRTRIEGTTVEAVGLTRPTIRQKELLERIGLTHLLQEEIIRKQYMEQRM